MKKLLFATLVLLSVHVNAQYQPPPTASEILNNIEKLNTVGSVLYIAAHPDDENTRLLGFLSKERKYRTGYLALTRGDGGQNLIGNEQGVELGLIRTQELLAARRVDGAEQFFSRAYDFGFSKTNTEALSIWNKEKILSDVVWVIRKFKPDVIITRFPNDNRAGHGHHWASAGLAIEAFDAAADPTKFPEQLQYVQPWQAKRIFWNTFNFGGNNTTSESQIKMDVGIFNPLLGKSYGEIASESRSQHKSQGFGVPRQRGQSFEYFLQLKGDPAKNDIMENINNSWSRFEKGDVISEMIEEVRRSYDIKNPAASIPALIQVKQKLQQPGITDKTEQAWREQKQKEIDEIILQCAGFFADATINTDQVVAGDKLNITVSAINRSSFPLKIRSVSINNFQSAFKDSLLAGNKTFSYNFKYDLPVDYPVSQPYWLNNFTDNGSFTVNDQQQIGYPEIPSLKVNIVIALNDYETIFISKPLQYRFTDPVKGELYQPVAIIPPATIEPKDKVMLFPNGKERSFAVKLHTYTDSASLTASLSNADAFDIISNPSPVDVKGKGNFKEADFTIRPKAAAELNKTYTANPVVITNNRSYDRNMKVIAYDHIPTQTYFPKASIKLLPIDLKIVGKKVGYIEGAGDLVPDALTQMGYEVKILKEADLNFATLKQFDAIITGVRAYNIHEYLSNAYEDLMKYVENGGNLIVQYNTNNQIGPVRAKMSPYNFNISRARVTEENAEVSFLLADHPALNYPNKITSKDFEGWIQERSIYMAEALDTNYKAVLSMHDTNEPAHNGSLIIAKYGKGNFVYTGLVFFRELPAAVAGAYRLMANLIALPKPTAVVKKTNK